MRTDGDTIARNPSEPRPADRQFSLGDQLVQAGHLTPDELHLALHEQRRRGEPLVKVLIDYRLVAPEVLSEFLGKQANTRTMSLKGFSIQPRSKPLSRTNWPGK